MKLKSGFEKSENNVIPLENYKNKKIKMVSSTIAAIIAIKIEHPKNISPEDYFLDRIDNITQFEVLAFEDALDKNNSGLTTIDAQNDALNDA